MAAQLSRQPREVRPNLKSLISFSPHLPSAPCSTAAAVPSNPNASSPHSLYRGSSRLCPSFFSGRNHFRERFTLIFSVVTASHSRNLCVSALFHFYKVFILRNTICKMDQTKTDFMHYRCHVDTGETIDSPGVGVVLLKSTFGKNLIEDKSLILNHRARSCSLVIWHWITLYAAVLEKNDVYTFKCCQIFPCRRRTSEESSLYFSFRF